MMTEDEKFFAWLDGELDPADAAEMEVQVAADPRLSRLAEQHRALGATVRAAFDPIVEAPVPDRLMAALNPAPAAKVVDIRSWRQRLHRPAGGPLPQWAALAATLVLGFGFGTLLGGSEPAAPVELRDGRMVAAAGLEEALDVQLASADARDDVRIGITFRDQAGTICRTFADHNSSGLACRAGGNWQVRGLFASPEGQQADYRMASSVDPNLAALVDSTIAGDAFDSEQERAAQRQGWR